MESKSKSWKQFDLFLVIILLIAVIAFIVFTVSKRSRGIEQRRVIDGGKSIIRTKVYRDKRGYKVKKIYEYKLIDSIEKVIKPGDGGFSTLEEI